MKALLVIDVQNDFCKGGSLEVSGGDEIISSINSMMKEYDIVVATKDWHPENHSSFQKNSPEGVWPNHCVKGTKGAELHPELDSEGLDFVFTKGSNPLVDSYSGFFENDKKTSTGLGEFLLAKGVSEVTVVGLALDYCVKFTAMDALKFNLKTEVVVSATRAVNISPNDGKNAIEEMKELGVIIK